LEMLQAILRKPVRVEFFAHVILSFLLLSLVHRVLQRLRERAG